MALVKCGECGGQVSDKAAACPHCGAPVRQSLLGKEMQERGVSAPVCPNCGSPVSDKVTTCPQCGSFQTVPGMPGDQPPIIPAQTAQPRVTVQPPAKKKSAAGGCLALAIIAVLVFGGIMSMDTGYPSSYTPPRQIQPKPDKADLSSELAKSFSKLEITDISYDGENVRITGSSDLPDGSKLDVTFNITGSKPDDLYIGVETQAEVEGGNFSVTLHPPNIQQYKKGPYQVEVRFRPLGLFGTAQSDFVVSKVGKAGENLTGEKVQMLPIGVNVLESSQEVQLSLQIKVPTYPQIDVSNHPRGSPERALSQYLAAWQNQNWKKMAKFTQKTWQDSANIPAEELMYMYDFKRLLGAKLGERSTFTENISVSISAVIYYSVRPTEIEKLVITPMVIREIAPHELSPSGDWGVNPFSMREEKIEE